MFIPRPSLLVTLFLLSFLYLSSNPFSGWYSIWEVIALTVLGYGLMEGINRLSRQFPPRTVLNISLATLIGLATATLIVFCCAQLYTGLSLPPLVALILLFLLPCATAAISYNILSVLTPFSHKNLDATPHTSSSTRTFLPDQSALEDGRILDLARTGLFDGQIVVPSFLPQELKLQSENGDEFSRSRAKRALESLRKLETLPKFTVHLKDIVITDTGDLNEKLLFAAKKLNAILLTNEAPLCKNEGENGFFLAVDTIASALRPSIPKGEALNIKIQRLGKEPKQGIGYLEDGTMVVVNGGGDFLGRNVRTQVLSQKYSSSGKIVFCNVREDDEDRTSTMVFGNSETSY